MTQQQKNTYTIGFLGSMAIVLAFLMFMYALTFETQGAFLYMALLGIAGLSLAFTMVGFHVGVFDFKRFGEALFWSAVSFGLIYLVNSMVPVRIDIGIPVNATLFAVLAAVCEELFFRVWLCTFTFKITQSMWFAAGLSGAGWALYHINRYGGSMNTLLIIGVAGFIQGWIMLYSRMADGPIFGHMLVNYLATA